MRKKLLAIAGTIAALWLALARHLHANYFIDVSLPFASRDGVEIRQPFSRVDVYIGPDTKIERTLVKNDFLARVAFE
jgi:hypothetical protein